MNDNEPIDLSALDPMSEPARWKAVVEATLARTDVVLGRRAPGDPFTLIASWRRPLLIAAGIAMALLIPIEIALETRESRSEQVERLVALSARWDHAELPPSGADFLHALVGTTP